MGITLWQSLSDRADDMALRAFEGVATPDDWERLRPQRRKEFFRCLGLDPLPERCDLKATDYGTFEGKGFRARRIAFQILPDCWTSACLYYPHPLPSDRLPGVLYVCGHAEIGTWSYQSHPVMWARRGYTCLIVDTVEQNDNPGEHHGTMMGRADAWQSLGYTPAGAEVWNAMRALDLLAADKHVDAERLGVTGVSGGGACSFHLAVVDPRLKAVSTLCGISSPRDAITNLHLPGHCDCMYPLNLYGRDISEYAALIAPRAALFCFADHDGLFHPQETSALVERTRRIYRLQGLEDRCELVTCVGPHGDHPEFDEATSRWFDRFVAGDERPVVKREKEQNLPESVTTVFNGRPPAPNRLEMLPQLMSPRGTLPLPRDEKDWSAVRGGALASLRQNVLQRPDKAETASAFALDGEWHRSAGPNNSIFRAHRGQINGVDVWLQMVTPPDEDKKLILSIAGEGESAQEAMCRVACLLEPKAAAHAGFQPRVAGFNSLAPAPGRRRAPGSRLRSPKTLLRNAMALTGVTRVMMTIEDIGLAVNYLRGRPEAKGRDIYLYGKGDSGVAALCYSLLDEGIAGVAVDDAPSSHLDGAPILGILRLFDVPQAVGLMAPRKVALINPGHQFWTWPTRVYQRLGCREHFIMTTGGQKALKKLVA